MRMSTICVEENLHSAEKLGGTSIFSALYAYDGCKLEKICIQCGNCLDYFGNFLKELLK